MQAWAIQSWYGATTRILSTFLFRCRVASVPWVTSRSKGRPWFLVVKIHMLGNRIEEE